MKNREPAASAQRSARSVDAEDLEALRQGIARVLDREAGRLDLHAHIDGKKRLDNSLWDIAAGLGWLAIGLPEAYGGPGFGLYGLDILCRELGGKAASGPFASQLAAVQTLLDVAAPETLAQWLPHLTAGECKIAVPARIAGASGPEDSWLLGAEDAEIALFPLDETNWDFVPIRRMVPVEMWDRTRPLCRAELDTGRPSALLPAAPTRRGLIRYLSLVLASDSIGGARAITEKTIAYMKERQQFGRAIASFQALKHRVADMMTTIVSCEEVVSLGIEAAAEENLDCDIWAALSKARATDAFVAICTDCTQLHGGVGYTWEFDVHVYLKRARLSEMLIASNTQIRDLAASGLDAAIRAGRQPLELAL